MPWNTKQLRSQLPDKNHIFIVAEDENGEAAGYVGMMFVLDEGYISNVAVAPEHRNRHVALSLIEELEKRAREQKLSFATLEVRESNAAAIGLYGKCGFTPVGLRKNYYEQPTENAILMTKYFK